jgi:hypothetical protein
MELTIDNGQLTTGDALRAGWIPAFAGMTGAAHGQ